MAGLAHALHDGYTDLLYVLVPVWQADFGLDCGSPGLRRRAGPELRGSSTGELGKAILPAAPSAPFCSTPAQSVRARLRPCCTV